MTLEEKYIQLCNTPSDINEHLPTLKEYASKCNHVTEMGVRYIVSTYALLMGKPKTMISYDINPCDWQPVKEMAPDTDFTFEIGDTLKIEIAPTELLFIDTLHNYNQLSGELKLHSSKASKYIILHDTTSFELHGESYTGTYERGLWPAVTEFLNNSPEWKLLERYTNNNGLTILARV
jgi:hypothetical protein